MMDQEPEESQSKDDQQNVQHIADIIGSWGPYQRKLMFLLIICYWAAPFNNQSLLYYVIKSDLWCEKSTGFRVIIFIFVSIFLVDGDEKETIFSLL